jgi:hypothetical protein
MSTGCNKGWISIKIRASHETGVPVCWSQEIKLSTASFLQYPKIVQNDGQSSLATIVLCKLHKVGDMFSPKAAFRKGESGQEHR